jgi:uncharacterized LabA/DUF88 family protein
MRQYKWLDLQSFARSFLRSGEVLADLKAKEETCRICHRSYSTWEEKRTDVNVAVTLFRLAHEDRFDTALLISGDTDLAPAVEMVRSTFPGKKVGVVFAARGLNARDA